VADFHHDDAVPVLYHTYSVYTASESLPQ